jgi:hypothetical protein
MEANVLRLYEHLVALYPEDVRYAYGLEMQGDFQTRSEERRRNGRLALTAFAFSAVVTVIVDVLVERANTLYSHRSFHGRGKPNPAVVRPPNMGKKEWFDAARGASAAESDGSSSPF